jgi:Exostosin family
MQRKPHRHVSSCWMSRFYRVIIIQVTFCLIVYTSLLFFRYDVLRTHGAEKEDLQYLHVTDVDKIQKFDFVGAANSDHDRDGRPSILNMTIYFMALQNSVRIVPLPSSLTHDIEVLCNSLGPKKQAISSHPHSLELHFPRTLIAMTSLGHDGIISINTSTGRSMRAGISKDITKPFRNGDTSFHFSPLWTPDFNSPSKHNLMGDPLFFYVAALPYHVIYCTNKKNDKEEWSGRDPYWKLVAQHLLADKSSNSGGRQKYNPRKDFLRNMGTDFLVPASHPLSGPSRIHPYSMSYLQRVTFLKTDLDISGTEKDIVVPYYTKYDAAASPVDEKLPQYAKWCEAVTGDALPLLMRPRLLFFAGGDNPIEGFRTLFLREILALRNRTLSTLSTNHGFLRQTSVKFQDLLSGTHTRGVSSATLDDEEIFFSLKSTMTPRVYNQQLLSSKFCLVLRGDTTSSKRLFSSIAAGCVPVIISDGLKIPFATIIDYSTFTLTFPESIVHDLKSLLDHIRKVSPVKYSRMRCALTEARRYLIFDHSTDRVSTDESGNEPHSRNLKSPINPVTLILLQAIMVREKHCLEAQRTGIPESNMCKKLMLRLQLAREGLFKRKGEPVAEKPQSQVTT